MDKTGTLEDRKFKQGFLQNKIPSAPVQPKSQLGVGRPAFVTLPPQETEFGGSQV